MIIGTETFLLGIKNLRLHKLRSFLTALGIIFGVGAVICMLSISEGASASEMELIALLGTQNVICKSVKPDRGSDMSQETEQMLAYGLTGKDLALIRATIPNISRLVPMREVCFERAFFGSGRIYIVGSDDAIFNGAPAIRANSARLYGPASVRESFRPQVYEVIGSQQ